MSVSGPRECGISAPLADALVRIMGLLQPGQVLSEACRQAAAVASAEVALASAAGAAERWTEDSYALARGPKDPGQLPPAAARSAMLELQRRLAEAPGPISAEPAAPGLAELVQRTTREVALLWAVPLRGRDGAVNGVLAVVSAHPEAASRVRGDDLAILGRAAETALENGLELAAARRHQERLLLFSEAADEAIWDWNPVTQQMWWAAGIHALIGPGGPQVEPTHAWKLGRIHPDDAPYVRRVLEDAAGSPDTSTWKAEYRFLRANGSWAWVEDRAHFLRDREGRALRVVGAMRDLTGLKDSTQRLAIMAEVSRVLSRATLAPDRLYDVIARTLAESLGDSCAVRLLSSDGKQVQTVGFYHRDPELNERLRDPVRTPTAPSEGITGQVLQARRIVLLSSVTAEELRRNSAIAAVQELVPAVKISSLVAAPINFGGRVMGVLICTRSPPEAYSLEDGTLLQDLADRAALAIANAHQQAELKDSEERLRLAVEATRLGTWELLSETHELRCDTRCRELLLIPGDGPVTYERMLQSVHPDHRGRASALLAAAEEGSGGAELRVELCLVRDGVERWVEVHARRSMSEVLPLYRLMGTVLDVTDRKRTERQLTEAIRARDEFLSIASHELRTPLTPLQLQLETLKRRLLHGDIDDRTHGQMDTALRQTHRLIKLVENLLDVSRISNGAMALELEECDLNVVARDVVERFRDEAARVGSRIELSLCPEAVGRWDRSRLEQVATNVLHNAIKYGPGQPILVTVSADPESARFAIADRGIGIDAQDAARIFRRFERAVSARHYGGLGLGLYIARQITEAHGGQISGAARSGGGSVFTVVLPRKPPASALVVSPDQKAVRAG